MNGTFSSFISDLIFNPAVKDLLTFKVNLLAQLIEEVGRMARRNLRDDQWEWIKDLLPGKASDPGRTAADNRLFVEAILWMARAGCPWRDLPEEFGSWNSVYKRFARWSNDGIWHRVFGELCEDADFEEVFMDSTIIKAHQHAAGAQKNGD